MTINAASRIISILFAISMCFGLGVCGLGIAFLIAHPFVIIIQHYFPRFRPVQPPPIFLNLHRRHDTVDYTISERTPRAGVKVNTQFVEKLPTVLPIAEPVEVDLTDEVLTDDQAGIGALTLGAMRQVVPIVPIMNDDLLLRRRLLVQHLRRTFCTRSSNISDEDLLNGWLRSLPKQRRARFL
jgi:hypothetical protein